MLYWQVLRRKELWVQDSSGVEVCHYVSPDLSRPCSALVDNTFYIFSILHLSFPSGTLQVETLSLHILPLPQAWLLIDSLCICPLMQSALECCWGKMFPGLHPTMPQPASALLLPEGNAVCPPIQSSKSPSWKAVCRFPQQAHPAAV